jgi:hypothetical protein
MYLNLITHQGNAINKHSEIALYTCENGNHEK